MWILVTGDRDQVSGACGWGAKTQTLKIFNKIFAAAKEAASTSVLKPSVQFWDAWLPASQHLGAWGAAGGVLEGPGNQAYRRQMPQKGPWGPLNPAFSSKYKTSVPRNVLHNFPWLSEKSWFHTVIWKPLQSKTELPVFNAYLPKLQMCFLASDSAAAHLISSCFPRLWDWPEKTDPVPRHTGAWNEAVSVKCTSDFEDLVWKKERKISRWYFHIDHMLKG